MLFNQDGFARPPASPYFLGIGFFLKKSLKASKKQKPLFEKFAINDKPFFVRNFWP